MNTYVILIHRPSGAIVGGVLLPVTPATEGQWRILVMKNSSGDSWGNYSRDEGYHELRRQNWTAQDANKAMKKFRLIENDPTPQDPVDCLCCGP